MKLEFIKELEPNNTYSYFTRRNGFCVSGSLALNEEEGRRLFEKIHSFCLNTNNETVLQTIVISEMP